MSAATAVFYDGERCLGGGIIAKILENGEKTDKFPWEEL